MGFDVVVIGSVNNDVTTTIVTRVQGNPNLEPEEADTTGLGIVYQPSWAPGLGMSVDFYDIMVDSAKEWDAGEDGGGVFMEATPAIQQAGPEPHFQVRQRGHQ